MEGGEGLTGRVVSKLKSAGKVIFSSLVPDIRQVNQSEINQNLIGAILAESIKRGKVTGAIRWMDPFSPTDVMRDTMNFGEPFEPLVERRPEELHFAVLFPVEYLRAQSSLMRLADQGIIERVTEEEEHAGEKIFRVVDKDKVLDFAEKQRRQDR